MVTIIVFFIIIFNIYAIMHIFRLHDLLNKKEKQICSQHLDIQLFMKIRQLLSKNNICNLHQFVELTKKYTNANSVMIYNRALQNLISSQDFEGALLRQHIIGDFHKIFIGNKTPELFFDKIYKVGSKDYKLLFNQSGNNIVVFLFDSRILIQEYTLDVIRLALKSVSTFNNNTKQVVSLQSF